MAREGDGVRRVACAGLRGMRVVRGGLRGACRIAWRVPGCAARGAWRANAMACGERGKALLKYGIL